MKNCNLEIERLKIEVESQSKCEECDFSSISEPDLKIHVETMHQHMCSYCGSSFAGEKRLKNHMCRIYINNPSSDKGYFTKDWFVRDKCIRVFENISETEVAALHTENCVENNICTTFPDDYKKTGSFKDDESITKLQAKRYI